MIMKPRYFDNSFLGYPGVQHQDIYLMHSAFVAVLLPSQPYANAAFYLF